MANSVRGVVMAYCCPGKNPSRCATTKLRGLMASYQQREGFV
jgi:hypothetical protein